MDKKIIRNISAILITFMFSAFAVFSIALELTSLSSYLHVSVSAILVAVPLDFIGGAIGSVLLGRRADRMGRKPMMILSVAVFSIGLLLASLIQNIYELYALWFVIGIGVNSQNGLSYPLLVETIKKSSGFIGSIMQGLYFIGFLLDIAFSLFFHFWRFYFLSAGLVSLIITIPLSLIMEETSVGNISAKTRIKLTERQVILTVALSMITVGAFMLSIPLLSVVPTLFHENNIPDYYIIILALIGFVGFAFAGYLSDRLLKWKVTVYFSIMGLFSGLLLFMVTRDAEIFGLMVLAYLSSGFFGFIGVWASMTYPREIRAASTNIVFIVGRIIGGFSPFLSVLIIPSSLREGISLMIIISTVIAVLGSIVYRVTSGNNNRGKTT